MQPDGTVPPEAQSARGARVLLCEHRGNEYVKHEHAANYEWAPSDVLLERQAHAPKLVEGFYDPVMPE